MGDDERAALWPKLISRDALLHERWATDGAFLSGYIKYLAKLI